MESTQQYIQKLQSLLQLEYDYEKELYNQQSERMELSRKIERGICWYPLSLGRSYYNSLNQLVIEVERTSALEVEHKFEPGRPICFFSSTFADSCKFLSFSATISYIHENKMVVVLPNEKALTELRNQGELGLQSYFDETSYQCMFSALRGLSKAQNERLAELREVILGIAPARKRNFFPMRFPWLNSSQEAAVNKVLSAKDVAIVHGPPGTGKTTTLVEAIYETLSRETQCLVCAQSNTAVDLISEKLVDRGVNVLRIGNPTRVNDKMLEFTYERRFEDHPLYSELWNIRQSIRQIQASIRNKSHSEKEALRTKVLRLRTRASELQVAIDEDIFSQARVVASTLVGSANKALTFRHFPSLFIDEAAQAMEPACWIAIAKADRVILAGDHQQLAPTVKCVEAGRAGLERTLLENLARNKPDVVSLLCIQYRMHQEIMEFSSRWFYNSELVAAPEVKYRGILDWDYPMTWIDTSDEEYKEEVGGADGTSRVNRAEALRLVAELKSYIEHVGAERVLEESIDFGLISPYSSQVQYIRRLIKRDSFFKPFRSLITVHTVDGFQGQERDVIFISLVRANEHGSIGFLGDLRRMNVAMTRARMKLVIIGDVSTLTHHHFYRELYEYVCGLAM